MAEESPVATVIVTCPDFTIVYGNRAFGRAAGREPDQFLGHCIIDLFEPREAAAKLQEAYRTGVAQYLQAYEMQLPFRTVSSYWDIDLLPMREPDGKVRAVVVKAVDITDRLLAQRQAEARAREAERAQRLLQGLLRQVPAGIVIAEAGSGRVFLMNEHAGRTASQSCREVEALTLDQVLQAWTVIRPDGTLLDDPEELPILRAARRGEVIEGERLTARDAAGRETVQLVNAAPIRDANGAIRWACAAWQDITILERTQAALEKALADKDVLMREVDHRVKNSLFLVSNLLTLQAYSESDPRVRGSLEDAMNRVTAVGRIHGLLYRAGATARLNFSQYLKELSADLVGTVAGRDAVEPVVDADDADLPTDVAAPLGLIASELLTNCVKYAYPDAPLGRIDIVFRRAEGRLELSVADRGVGLPPGFDPGTSEGFGMKMIQSVVEGYGGTLDAVNLHPGARFTVVLPHKGDGA